MLTGAEKKLRLLAAATVAAATVAAAAAVVMVENERSTIMANMLTLPSEEHFVSPNIFALLPINARY